ncbi:MAG: hypothetical protein LBD99_06620 [Candidatus Margulisbacteria bacterium]|jgi:hypothetical protein|nr:hypothetical protein [Candidatus Margulisiibacteriota bacterium]
MNSWLERLREEFAAAPLWQKIVLPGLAALLVFYFTLYPLFSFSARRLAALEKRRAVLSAELRLARSLIEDEKVLLAKYNELKRALAAELSPRQTIAGLVQNALGKNAVRVYELTDSYASDYGGAVAELTVRISARVLARDLQPLLDGLLAPAYSRAEQLNYQDNVLTAEFCYLVKENKS